jgi:hypothetical protein
MNKEFIPYEQALELKQLGFNEPCFCIYNRERELRFNNLHNPQDRNKGVKLTSNNGRYPAPLYQQAFRWFREKYGYLSYIDMDNYSFYRFTIYKGKGISEAPYHTYEEAEQACINKLIEIVKDGTKINTRED